MGLMSHRRAGGTDEASAKHSGLELVNGHIKFGIVQDFSWGRSQEEG